MKQTILALLAFALIGAVYWFAAPGPPGSGSGGAYPQSAVARFVADCESSGGAPDTCRCLIIGMQARYSYSRFQQLVAADNAAAPEYRVVAQGCAGK